MANPEYEEQRYRIMSDDSGHDYYVKIEDENKFNRWVEADEEDRDKDCYSVFEENRIDGRFTFTDPRCE